MYKRNSMKGCDFMAEIKIRGIDESLKQHLVEQARKLYFPSLNAFLITLLEEYKAHNNLLPYQVAEEQRQAGLAKIIEENTQTIVAALAYIEELENEDSINH